MGIVRASHYSCNNAAGDPGVVGPEHRRAHVAAQRQRALAQGEARLRPAAPEREDAAVARLATQLEGRAGQHVTAAEAHPQESAAIEPAVRAGSAAHRAGGHAYRTGRTGQRTVDACAQRVPLPSTGSATAWRPRAGRRRTDRHSTHLRPNLSAFAPASDRARPDAAAATPKVQHPLRTSRTALEDRRQPRWTSRREYRITFPCFDGYSTHIDGDTVALDVADRLDQSGDTGSNVKRTTPVSIAPPALAAVQVSS